MSFRHDPPTSSPRHTAHRTRHTPKKASNFLFPVMGNVLMVATLILTYDQIKSSFNAIQQIPQHCENSMHNNVPSSTSSPPPTHETNGAQGDNDPDDTLLQKRFDAYYRKYRYVEAAPRHTFSAVPLAECGVAPDFGEWFALDGTQRSRLNEDKIIYETFFKKGPIDKLANGHDKGTYIELGAFDGLQESNTRFFDACLGWEGLLLEGSPLVYLQTVGTRPFAHRMSYAPSCQEANSTVRFHTVPWTNGGLEGSAKSYDGEPVPTVDVPCGPLAPVIQDIFRGTTTTTQAMGNNNTNTHATTTTTTTNIPTVNFFSLDVEGAELLVLDTIDFRSVHIDVLMTENTNDHCEHHQVCEVRERVRAKMNAEGYTLYDDMVTHSDVFVHPKSLFQPSAYGRVIAPKRADGTNR